MDDGPPRPQVAALLTWFDGAERDLPWRGRERDPWAVLVSEVMLQQTPVARVMPVYEQWLARWPTPGDLADAGAGDAVRVWGRLGYPRRALRLHAAAREIVARFDGELPRTYDELVSLPGVGDYTAAAVLAFAGRRRIPVLDTNVRRVLARAMHGRALPATAAAVRSEREELLALLPESGEDAARLSEAIMELGALVCTARDPHCGECPWRDDCHWRAAGLPDNQRPASRQATFAGSDRQVRGAILAVLRSAAAPVPQAQIDAVWPDESQRQRAQASLAADGLIRADGVTVCLPE